MQEKCEQYRKGMKIPPYKTDNDITYLTYSMVSLDGHVISNAFISDCSGINNYTFTVNVSEYYYGPFGLQTSLLQFSASILNFSPSAINIMLGFSVQLVNISAYFAPHSFMKIEIGSYIGLGLEIGTYVDPARWRIEIYCNAGAVLGFFSKTTIDVVEMIVPVS